MRRPLQSIVARFLGEERGAVLVELTLLMPFLLALSAGAFEFGNLIHQKLLIEAGLRDAARYAARCNTKMYEDDGDATTSINCQTNAQNIALYGNAAGTGSLRIPTWNFAAEDNRPASQLSVTIPDPWANPIPADCRQAVVAGVVEYHSVTPLVCVVRASATFSYRSLGLLDLIGIQPITLTAVHEERLVRF